MSEKVKENKTPPVEETKTPPVEETKAPITNPISIMGDPKPVEPKQEITTKAFSDLQKAVEELGSKIDGFIPKNPVTTQVVETPPTPKAYKLFDEFEVI